MKRILVFLIVLLILATTMSCSHSLTPVAPVPSPSASTPPSSVEPPVQTEKTTSVTTIPQSLEIKWEASGPSDAQSIWAIVIDDCEGKIVYAIGSKPNQLYPVDVWKTEDGGQSWSYTGAITSPDVNFKNKEDLVKEIFAPTISLTWEAKEDLNDQNIVLKPKWLTVDDWQFLLSFDGGSSWFELNLPSDWKPQGNQILTERNHFNLVSSNGTLKLFLAAGKVWQAEISLPR